jgi:hypothetical protein
MLPSANVLSIDEAIKELSATLQAGELAVFAGSGVSRGSGLPSWDDLLQQLLDWCQTRLKHCILLAGCKVDDELIGSCRENSKAKPAVVAGVVRDMLSRLTADSQNPNLDALFKRWLTGRMTQDGDKIAKPNANHRAIIKTDYACILTSNYDNLFEAAAADDGREQLSLRAFGLNFPEKVAFHLRRRIPFIWHVHGDLHDISIDNFVLTTNDYVKIRLDHPWIDLLLEVIFMQFSVLFVGYGASDPHLEDFIENLNHAFRNHRGFPEGMPKYYFVIRSDKASRVLIEHKSRLNTRVIKIDDWAETEELLHCLQQVCPRPAELAGVPA